MIDRAATIEKFGYDPDELKPKSGKRVVAVCDGCGKVRDSEKKGYRDRCPSCVMKKHFEDPEAHKKQSESLKKYYKDNPEARKRNSDAQKKHHEDHPERGKKHGVTHKKYWKDHPEARNGLSTSLKKYHKDNPEAGEKHSVRLKKYYEDHPAAIDEMRISNKKYYEDHPEARERASALAKKHFEDPEIREKYSVAQKNRWEDPIEHEKASAAQQGIDYNDWVAFAKDKPYCPAFNEACRESNREKYGRKCFICGLPEAENITKKGKQVKLSIHHIDLNKNQGCDGHEWRLIPTCMRHHNRVIHTPLWIERITYLLRIGA